MTSQWRRERDRQPERRPALPIWPFEVSNGEFLPRTHHRHATVPITRQVLDRIDLAAARTGYDRRRFLTRSGAVAATLTVLNSCASGGRYRDSRHRIQLDHHHLLVLHHEHDQHDHQHHNADNDCTVTQAGSSSYPSPKTKRPVRSSSAIGASSSSTSTPTM